MIIECIKEGFNVANKNLQLVLIRITVTIINLIGFFIFLGVPIIAAVSYMGLQLVQAKDLLPFLVKNPFEFISGYLGLVFLVGVSFIFYLTLSSMLFLYSLGGTIGVLRNSAVNMQYKFSLSSFFKEANRNFSRLFWLISLLLLGFTVMFIAFAISGGIIAAAASALTGEKSVLDVFFNSFIMMSLIISSAIFFLAGLVFIVYSMAASIIEGKGAVSSIKNAFNFLRQKPEAFLFYIILFAGIVASNFVFFILRLPFSMVPVFAPMMNIALSLMNAVFQGYLAIVVWSSLIIYYVKAMNYPIYSATYEI